MSERDIFLALLDLPDPTARAQYLDRVCQGDSALRGRIEALLRSHESAGSFLGSPAVPNLSATCELAGGDAREPEIDLGFLLPSQRPGSLGRIGHYEILEVLGRGGFGIVLKAADESLQRVVAVKVLAPHLAVTSPARKRFLREAQSSARVRHDNVVRVYAVEAQPLPYLVMEYIPGETLQQLLDRTGPLTTVEVVRIGRQIAEGLAAAHATGLIHRDIKPANILIESDSNLHARITDFGLARAADDASLSQSGFVAGTPLFMAPEQARGETLDARADLFSLGSVLYTMCCGRPPFRADTTIAVLKRVVEDTPRPIRDLIPETPEWLCEIINRLHAKKPEDRFASAREVADLLTKRLAELDNPTVPPRVPIATTRPIAPRRRRWLAALVVLLVLLGVLGVTEATDVTDVGGVVLRFFSPEGTLVVEVDDPGVRVAIDGDDMVITGAGVREIRLKTGQHHIEASKDGKVVRKELVTIERNGRQLLRVHRESPPTPAKTDDWMNSVAALPAAEQVQAVIARLRQLNPNFNGDATPTITDNVVTGLAIRTDQVSDLSPIRALGSLQSLTCEEPDGKGKLVDLGPLRGLKLRTFNCTGNLIVDLSPLREMPLTSLYCRVNQVNDLSPLKDLKLTKLECGCTFVKDLTPLKDMKLTHLVIDHLAVSDLSPLKGMPLTFLHCGGSVTIKDLSPIRGMPLKILLVRDTAVTDLSAVEGMALTEISCNFQAERDAKLLRSLTTLKIINHQRAADFWKEAPPN